MIRSSEESPSLAIAVVVVTFSGRVDQNESKSHSWIGSLSDWRAASASQMSRILLARVYPSWTDYTSFQDVCP